MSKFNSTVLDVFKVDETEGEVGIEIEMEGHNLFHGHIPPYWNYHADGSLRGADSAEYVLQRPLPRASVSKSLEILFDFLTGNGSKIRQDSPNTSVHVHLNVQQWTLKQVYTFICLWYIFENTLLEWCGEDRIGNLFCLRASDAEVAVMRLASAGRYGRFQTLGDQDGLRYTALNYTSLAKFGSLEFRPLAGVYEKKVIEDWVGILLSLKDFAEKFTRPSDVIVEYSRSSPSEFLKMALPKHWELVKNENFEKQLHDGMRLAQSVAYCVNWDKAPKKVEKEEPRPQFAQVDDVWDDNDVPIARPPRPLRVNPLRENPRPLLIRMPMAGPRPAEAPPQPAVEIPLDPRWRDIIARNADEVAQRENLMRFAEVQRVLNRDQ